MGKSVAMPINTQVNGYRFKARFYKKKERKTPWKINDENSLIVAEVLAIGEVINLAKHCRWSKVGFFSDSKIACILVYTLQSR